MEKCSSNKGKSSKQRMGREKKKTGSEHDFLIDFPPESCLVKKTEVGENTIAARFRKKKRERTYICFLLFVDLSWAYSCEKKARRRSGFTALNYHIRLSKKKEENNKNNNKRSSTNSSDNHSSRLMENYFSLVSPLYVPFFLFFMYVLYRVTGRGPFGYLCGCLPFST